MFTRDVSVAIHYHIDRITLRVVHGGDIRVLRQHDRNGSWMFREVLFYRFIGFENIDCEYDQPVIGEFFCNVVNQRCFVFAVFAPTGPELEQNNFAFDRSIVELATGCCFGSEARSRLAAFVGGKALDGDQCHCGQQQAA